MTTPVLRSFEGPIYRFINKKNEESIRGAAAWLAAHPEFGADLAEAAEIGWAPHSQQRPYQREDR